MNYFQVEDVIRIREALECEPLKWKVITHLLLITGCRRGEVMGLRWSRVDFANSQIRIDTIAFDVRIAWQSVVFSILLTAVFAAIVNVVMYFKLRRISMAESLKSIE